MFVQSQAAANFYQSWFDRYTAVLNEGSWKIPRDGDRILNWKENKTKRSSTELGPFMLEINQDEAA